MRATLQRNWPVYLEFQDQRRQGEAAKTGLDQGKLMRLGRKLLGIISKTVSMAYIISLDQS